MTPQQISYMKTLTVLGLAGGLAGMGIQQIIVKDTTLGTNVLSVLFGAVGVLIPAGVLMRVTGKEMWPSVPAEEVVFAGLNLNSLGNIYGRGGTVDQLTDELAQQKADVRF